MNEELDSQSSSPKTMGRFAETERNLLVRIWLATSAQRLAWLEEALEFAYRAGTIPSTINSHNHGNLDRPCPKKPDEW
jgi:hypothetical protein